MRLSRVGLLALIEDAQRLEEFAEAVERATGPADAGSIVDFFDVPTADIFNVPPEQAIKYFKAKGLATTFSYTDAMGAAHDQAFTVAKMMDVDLLGQVRASLDSAMANGTPFKEWSKEIMPSLVKAGWWGRKELVDPLTGQTVKAQLGSPWRLETIFRTNMQSAYAAGQWEEIQSQAEIAPLLLYDAVDDFRTRPMHKAWDNKVLPVDSPFWKTHYPPNGYNCRCGVIQIDYAEAKRLGLPVSDLPKPEFYNWKNPRTGEIQKVPVGIDPGFDRNTGTMFVEGLKQQLADKVASLPPTMKAAVSNAMSPEQVAAMVAGQRQAAAEILKAEQAAAKELSAMRAKAQEAAKQLAAQDQIDMIALGDKGLVGAGAQYKVKALAQLKKGDDWPELTPVEKLDAINAQAAKLKTQNETASKVALYKKQAIEGKTPAPGAVKAFQSLDPADQAAVLKAIDEAKAKIAAQAAAQAASEAQALAKAAGVSNPTPKTESLLLGDSAPNPQTMVVYARKDKGGTPGAYYQDTSTGQRYLVKFNGSEDAVKNEVLAGKLYQLAGLDAPDLYAIEIEGQWALASRLVEGIKEVGPDVLKATDSVMDGFAVDAWLANWDVMGLKFDNTVLRAGRAVRIDVGGSLRYRAVGGLKGAAFGDTVTEIQSLRNAGLNAQAAEVFGRITKDQIEAGVIKVLRTSDDDIRSVVEKYGPPDLTERRILADRLIARKRDLARQFPEAAARAQGLDTPAQAPALARVTEAEQSLIVDARANGYGFKTDGDQIEDHMVVVNTLKTAKGEDGTRGWLKARPEAADALLKRIKGAEATVDAVDFREASDAILAAVKGINFRAAKGWEQKDLDRIDEALGKLAKLDDDFKKSLDKIRLGQRAIAQTEFDQISEWGQILRDARQRIVVGGTGDPISRMFDYTKFSASRFEYTVGGSAASSRLAWKRLTEFNYEVAEIKKGRISLTNRKHELAGVSEVYETTLADGTRVRFITNSTANGYSMRGTIQIDAPGAGVASTSRIFDVMNEIGLDSTRSTPLQRDDLYLNAFARMKYARDATSRQAFAALDALPIEQRIAEKLAFIKRKSGVDVAASEGWRQRDGVYQAFGHGRAKQYRPDLDTPSFDRFAEKSGLYHDPNYCKDTLPIWDRLRPIMEAGGHLASIADRVRRGVVVDFKSTASGERDIRTGGGSYYFTRIVLSKSSAGYYWKPKLLKRMDAVTYYGDPFGKVDDAYQASARLGQDVQSFIDLRDGGTNETIFKDSLDIFTDLDFVRFDSAAGRKEAIDWAKANGYAIWPDGRKIEDVFR